MEKLDPNAHRSMAGPNQVSPTPTPPMAGQILRDNKANRTGSRKPLCIGLTLLAVATILLGCLLPLYFLEITPFDKDGTARSPPPPIPLAGTTPSPPPPIPLAGTSASTVKFELIAEGAVTDYTDAKKATIAENVATNLGVNVADVTVTVTAASVIITVVVKTDTPDTTKAALEAKVASPTTASALLGGDVVVTSVTNAVFDVPSPPPSPPPTGSPVVVTGLKTVVGLTTVEATGGSRRQLRNLGRFAPRRLNTRPTGGEYADTSDQVPRQPPLALATRPITRCTRHFLSHVPSHPPASVPSVPHPPPTSPSHSPYTRPTERAPRGHHLRVLRDAQYDHVHGRQRAL